MSIRLLLAATLFAAGGEAKPVPREAGASITLANGCHHY